MSNRELDLRTYPYMPDRVFGCPYVYKALVSLFILSTGVYTVAAFMARNEVGVFGWDNYSLCYVLGVAFALQIAALRWDELWVWATSALMLAFFGRGVSLFLDGTLIFPRRMLALGIHLIAALGAFFVGRSQYLRARVPVDVQVPGDNGSSDP